MDPSLGDRDTRLAEPGLAPGAVVAGRYRIERLLGRGGMGAVYRAEHVHMRKTVALKVLHPELASVSEVVARFEREAVAAARIEHPNVVAASDFGKLEDGLFYLVLEYVDGQSLRELIARGPLPLPRALDVARQTALALSAAHAAGIVHRDLKPDNVMLLPDPGGGERVKVLDFGIARVSAPDAPSDTHLTRAGVVMGTVAYMSPEQATGQSVDGRTDLYALGAMLYEMISGHPPFEAELPTQVLARQLVEPPPPLPEGTPPPLVRLVNELLAKAPADRPQTANQVLARLSALSTPSGRVVPARPVPSIVYAGIGLFVLLLIAVVLVALTRGGEAAEQATPEPAPSGSASRASSTGVTASDTSGGLSPQKANGTTASSSPPSAAARTSAAASSRTNKGSTTKKKPAQKEATPQRKTGPGGIYVPPPSTWFKGL